jgi:hypothetical protein
MDSLHHVARWPFELYQGYHLESLFLLGVGWGDAPVACGVAPVACADELVDRDGADTDTDTFGLGDSLRQDTVAGQGTVRTVDPVAVRTADQATVSTADQAVVRKVGRAEA